MHLAMQTFSATAYDLQGPTKHGEPAGIGIVAVDPRVIPLGTRLNIEGLGEFIALDTGKDIKGNRIDIWMPTEEECIAFGRQQVNVTIIPQKNRSPPVARGTESIERRVTDGRQQLGREDEDLRAGGIRDPNTSRAGQIGYNKIGELDRYSILKGSVRPIKSQNNFRANDSIMEGHKDRILPTRIRRYPKRTRSTVNPVRKKAKGRRLRLNYRKCPKYSRGKIFLHGGSRGHFEREAQLVSDSSGKCEVGEGSDEVERGEVDYDNQ